MTLFCILLLVFLAFFGFLRCGELTINSREKFSSSIHLCLSDIDLSGRYQMSVNLKSSKADIFRKGVTITVGALQPISRYQYCPYAYMTKFIKLRQVSGAEAGDPLFLDSSGNCLYRDSFIKVIKQGITFIGLDPQLYNGHSFRIGAASTAASQGIPDHLIQTMGRWSSDSYLRYIRTDITTINKAQKKMAIFS